MEIDTNKDVIYILIAAHSLVEVYSVLTGAPFKPRISSSTAKKLIEQNIREDAKIIALSEQEYFRIIENMDQLGLRGGTIYDALIVECARKSTSKQIVTSNTKDFFRLIPGNSIKIINL